MATLAIYNPVCGTRQAKQIWEENVFPLLTTSGKAVAMVAGTESPDHAGQILAEFMEENEGDITLILLSGDGTLHEIINFISAAQFKGPRATLPPFRLGIVLVPCGTANALYYSLFPLTGKEDDKLQSVQSFVKGGNTVPLTLAISTLSYPPFERKRPKTAVAAVVASTCFHACLLRDSEALRAEHPGLERYKLAAQNNGSKWFNSHVKLLPPSTGTVEIYDPAIKSFVPHPDTIDSEDDIVDLFNYFCYFVATVNVDRLEPSFRISPLAKDIHPTPGTFDIVIIRPMRDPSITVNDEQNREAFSSKLFKVMEAAYQNGNHVNLRYNASGEIVTDGDGPSVVEYVRCGGWEWIPDDEDEDAHVFCSDGAISLIEKGGRVVSLAATPDKTAGFVVYT